MEHRPVVDRPFANCGALGPRWCHTIHSDIVVTLTKPGLPAWPDPSFYWLHTTINSALYTAVNCRLYTTVNIGLYTTINIGLYTTINIGLYTKINIGLYTTFVSANYASPGNSQRRIPPIVFSCRNPSGWTMPRWRPQVSWLRA